MTPATRLPIAAKLPASSRRQMAANLLAWGAAAMVTLLPICNIATILFSTWADNPSNDYLQYMGLIDKVLNGTYNWSNYIADTFYRTHSVALPVFIHIINAALLRLNMYAELAAGMSFAALRLVFLYLALGRTRTGWRKIALLPALSLLVFSNSQMAVFGFGDAALTIELSLLGCALGIWGLSCLRSNFWRAACMLAGGTLASYSWGNGPVTWVVLLAALILVPGCNRWLLCTWSCGCLMSALPYLQALVFTHPTTAPANGRSVVSFWNSGFMINLLGWPFTSSIASNVDGSSIAKAVGWSGLGFAACTAFALARVRRGSWWLPALPAVLFLFHGLLSVWQISVFRALLAPWYSAVAMCFWIALTGLVFLLCEYGAQQRPEMPAINRIFASVCSWAFLLFLAAAYLSSNLSYEDKTEILFSRSPASASVIRHYDSLPLAASKFVFQWGGDHTGLLNLLAVPLQRHRLSVFSPHQLWSMQGDCAVGAVAYDGRGPARWIDGTSSRSMPWWHYKHLNLMLAPGESATWTVAIPRSLIRAEFYSAVALPAGHTDAVPATVAIVASKIAPSVERSTTIVRDSQWHAVHISLGQFCGQTVRIKLTNAAAAVPAPVIWRFPQLETEQF